MEDFLRQVWTIVTTVADPRNLSHPEKFEAAFNQPGVFWAVFAAVTTIVFTETGLLVGFLLPGDSMLVVLGLVAQISQWDVGLLLVSLCLAAVVGDTVGYWIGAKAGPALFNRPDGRVFKQAYVQKAHDFYERHGGKTIVFARFVPIVRTFVPVVAGAAKMEYKTFLFFNVIGGVGWILSMFAFGYFLIPVADPLFQKLLGKPDFTWKKNIDILAAFVIAVSVLPIVYKAATGWLAARKANAVPVPTPGAERRA